MAGFAGWRFNAAMRHPIFRASAERKNAMFERVKSFIRAFHIPTAAELEREYLNGAANRVDLEFRQRQVERGMFRNFGA
ncbi:MAG: hypothetical protein Q27BPR15_10240 [Rhodobacter sp. CACIA14H1]|nr:MAG: hypothetical protein Q27BPR15_10240 [Rhodobacter sp. CACIA14H1]